MMQTEEACRYSKCNVRFPSPGYCIPAPRECKECKRFKEILTMGILVRIEDEVYHDDNGVTYRHIFALEEFGDGRLILIPSKLLPEVKAGEVGYLSFETK